ncbi:MAG: glycosyl hydrolase family 18 protein [Acholeplasmataceae bacterium]|nr:glycosyl hydrolase family 18 protein [Acholeplasmataceae bacterium]
MKRYASLLFISILIFLLYGCTEPIQNSDPTISNPDVYVDVNVTLDLEGGHWNSDIFSLNDPKDVLTITALNNTTGTAFTLIDTKNVSLRWFYKIFIVYNETYKAYQVVGKDAAKTSVINFNLPDYDYALAIHDNLDDLETKDIFKSYVENKDEQLFLLFDQELSTYTEGLLEVSFYPEESITFDYTKVMNQTEELPIPIRSEFNFIGWSDGTRTFTNYPRYLAKDNISNVTYQALWEGYSMENLELYLSSFIPTLIIADIKLPTSYSKYQIEWSSNDESIISNTGSYNKPYHETAVMLTATITFDDQTEIRYYPIETEGYKKLTTGIASSYIYRNYHLLSNEFFETLDIINTAFIIAADDASLNGTNYLANVQNYIMPRAKLHGNWVIMSIAPESSWSTIAASPTLVNRFADNIVDKINAYGFDGVDIDWETPTYGEMTLFTELMRVVHTKVKANNPNHLVTAAIAGGMWQPPRYDLINSQQYMDYINMMTYGMTSSNGYYQNALFKDTTNHHPTFGVGRTLTSCSIEESVAIYHNDFNIPYSKIIVGVAFYGMKQIRTFNSSTQTWSGWIADGSVYYAYIANNYLNSSSYTRFYDTSAGVPYIVKNDGTEFISYDDPRSIADKSAYILANNLGGMMFWENGTDTTGTLLAAMREGLNK